jgi:putative flippase GtrA
MKMGMRIRMRVGVGLYRKVINLFESLFGPEKFKVLCHEGFFFILVGVLASLVNLGVVIFLVEWGVASPLWANLIAFCIAYQVSFLGHHHFTFRHKAHSAKKAWVKFLSVALTGLALSEIFYAIFMHILHIHYITALLLVFILVPIFTFLLGKFWAFR